MDCGAAAETGRGVFRFGYGLNGKQTELGVGRMWRCGGRKHSAMVCDRSCCGEVGSRRGEGDRDGQATLLSDVRVQGTTGRREDSARAEGVAVRGRCRPKGVIFDGKEEKPIFRREEVGE